MHRRFSPEPSTVVLAVLAAAAVGVVLGRNLLARRWEVRPLTV